ncbi:MAG TPA: efflux RND transporter periplasmic adaptor subunit [Gallionella sp.]
MNMNIKHRRLAIGAALSSVAVVGVALWLPGSSGAEEAAPVAVSRPALTIHTTTLREEKWTRTLDASGSIIPWQEAVISAQLQGVRIADVKVSIGDRVSRGDVLLTLDNAAAPEGAAQGRIVAPDDGVISAANANAGSLVKSGDELFRMIRKGRLEWRAELTAEELMQLRKGMQAEITVGEGRVLKGVVRAISPSVNMQTRYGYALVTLEDSSGIIAGAFARGTFDVSAGGRKLQSLPQSAVMRRGSTAYVLAVGADGRVKESPVQTGQRNGDRIEIKQGLKSGEQVVLTGGAFLTEGDVVQVLK